MRQTLAVALCDQCGFRWDDDVAAAAGVVRHAGVLFTRLLRDPRHRTAMRRRPHPEVWSAIEYAGHTRDALAWYAERISQIIVIDGAPLSPFDPDAVADAQRDRERDVEEVLAGLDQAAVTLADLVDGIEGPEWSHVGIGGDGTERDIPTLARRAAHEVRHHLADAERVLAEAGSPDDD